MTIIHIQPGEWTLALERIKQAKKLAHDLNQRAAAAPAISNVAVYAALDRSDWRCPCCCKRDDLLLDYVRPMSEGGQHVAENIRVICWQCLTVQRVAAIWLKWTPAHRILPPKRSAPPVYVNPHTIARQMGQRAIGE